MHKLYEEKVKNLIVSMREKAYRLQFASDIEIAEFLLSVAHGAVGDIKVTATDEDVVYRVSFTNNNGDEVSIVIVEGILLPSFKDSCKKQFASLYRAHPLDRVRLIRRWKTTL